MTRKRPHVPIERVFEGDAGLLSRRNPTATVHVDGVSEDPEAPEEDASLAARHHRAQLGSPIPFAVVAVPRVVKVDATRLVWERLGMGKFPDTPGLLGRFVALREAPPEQIAAFARLYGVLGLCEHGHPWPHVSAPGNGSLIVCPWQRHGPNGGEEPVAAWRALAGEAAALLEQMAGAPHLRALHLPSVEEKWLKPAHVRLCVEAGDPVFSTLSGDAYPFGLFAALAVQLLAVGIGAKAVRRCDGCQTLFFEDREPPRRVGRRVFCTKCRGRKARAAASKDYRARKRAKAGRGKRSG